VSPFAVVLLISKPLDIQLYFSEFAVVLLVSFANSSVMGYTRDDFPHVGAVPGKPGQFIAAGFNGHGMPVIFLTGKAIAEMVLGKTFEESGVPKIFKTTEARLEKA